MGVIGRSSTTISKTTISSTTSTKRIKDVPVLLLSIVASLAFLAALVGLLAAFDGRPIFDYGQVTLNTLIAILSAANKATIIYAVGHAIGQWKWISFSGRERRRLLDFERIESASRGPLGSLSLLGNRHVKRVSTIRIGAFLTVLAVAMDPFAQQLLRFRPAPDFVSDESGRTAIARAQRYSKGTERRLQLTGIRFNEGNRSSLSAGGPPVRAEADFSMQSAIMYGIVEPLVSVSQQASVNCPSGRCTYPEFSSLSVCSACQDLSSTLTFVEAPDTTRLNISFDKSNPAVVANPWNLIRYYLANGLYLDNTVGLTMFGTANASKSIAFQDKDTLIWSQSLIRHRTDPTVLGINQTNPGLEATECALFYCVKRYTSTVDNGTLSEASTVDSSAVRNPDSWSIIQDRNSEDVDLTPSRRASLSFHPRFSYLARTDLELGVGYNISQAAVDGISSYVQSTFASCTPTTNCNSSFEAVAENWTPNNGFYMETDWGSFFGRDVQYTPAVAQELWRSANISATFASVAASMSNALRAGADDADPSSSRVQGLVGVATTLYAVDWRWLALHCVVELGGIAFVAWTLMKSWGGRNLPLWGSSTLAVLSRGGEVAELFRGAETVAEMEARARAVGIVLVDGLVGEVQVGMEDDDLMMDGEGQGNGHGQGYGPGQGHGHGHGQVHGQVPGQGGFF